MKKGVDLTTPHFLSSTIINFDFLYTFNLIAFHTFLNFLFFLEDNVHVLSTMYKFYCNNMKYDKTN